MKQQSRKNQYEEDEEQSLRGFRLGGRQQNTYRQQHGRSHHGELGAETAPPQPRFRIAQENHAKQRRSPSEPCVILPEPGEQSWRQHRDEHSSHRAASSHHQVEEREVLRARLQPRQFSMADHAAHKQNSRIHGNLYDQAVPRALIQEKARSKDRGAERSMKPAA